MKKVIVTGGSRGIGAAIVKKFTANGDLVSFLYQNSDDDAKQVSTMTGAFAVKADVADPSSARVGIAEAISHMGGVDVLVNNAGISEFAMFCDISEDMWKRMFEVNVGGVYRCTQAAIPYMINRKYGRIINISSMWGQVGSSCEVHYSASKAAVIGMTRALAKELGPSGITVNCVAPGIIDTDMNTHIDKNIIEGFADETPLCRIGSVDEVAGAVCFLAGDDAAFITGQVIGVNGGYVV